MVGVVLGFGRIVGIVVCVGVGCMFWYFGEEVGVVCDCIVLGLSVLWLFCWVIVVGWVGSWYGWNVWVLFGVVNFWLYVYFVYFYILGVYYFWVYVDVWGVFVVIGIVCGVYLFLFLVVLQYVVVVLVEFMEFVLQVVFDWFVVVEVQEVVVFFDYFLVVFFVCCGDGLGGGCFDFVLQLVVECGQFIGIEFVQVGGFEFGG